MKKALLLILAVITALGVNAQIITTNPPILTQSSKGIVLTYHPAAEGSNKALANLPASTAVYAHIGLITDKSSSTSDWKFAPTWGDNAAKFRLTYAGPNTYTLNIGDFRTYFPNMAATDVVKRIAMVFRTGDNSREGKTEAGGDIFVDVYPDGFNMSFTSSMTGIAAVGDKATFNIATTEAANITLKVNGTQVAAQASATSLSHTYSFAALGSYDFEATAVSASGATVTKTLNITVPKASEAAAYPGGTPVMGAVAAADGSVTFCLAAPGKNSVILVPSWDDFAIRDANVMAHCDYQGNRYFWVTVKGLDPHQYYTYYYLVDGNIKVADPYARLVLDNYSDKFIDATVWPDMPKYPYDKFDDTMLAVYRGDMDTDYNFSDFTIPDHHNLMIYELLIRDFTGDEGKSNGNGTLRKAIEKIPYLVDLGINAVELMPVMEFNGNNSWGYNTNFYFAPDKAYGSPRDLKDFVEICHRNGIAVILDIVFNQSDGLHPWYRMYPVESNPFYNATAPHDYSVLNDWKQDNPLVEQQWNDALRYWMTAYNVDGFRFDLVKGLGDNNSYGAGTEAKNDSRINRMKRLHRVITSVKPNGIHINEDLAGEAEETELGQDGQLQWGKFTYNFTQYCMGYAEEGGARLSQLYRDNGRPAGSFIAYAESHDEERVAYSMSRYAVSSLKSTTPTCRRLGQLAAQLLLAPGPKMIWQFGELGANQTTKNSSGNNTDPKRVIWNNLNNVNYAGLHDTYRALFALRQDNPELFGPSAEYSFTGLGGNVTSARTITLRNGNKEVIAFINPNASGSAMTVSASARIISASDNQVICGTPGITTVLNGNGNVSVSLPANTFVVYANRSVTGVDDVIAGDSNGVVATGGIGEILINGDYTTAEVYTLDGRATGLTGLAAGVYIVRIDGRTTKVVVK